MGPGEGGRERMRERNEWCSSGRLHFFPPTAHTNAHTDTKCVSMQPAAKVPPSARLEWSGGREGGTGGQWRANWNKQVIGGAEMERELWHQRERPIKVHNVAKSVFTPARQHQGLNQGPGFWLHLIPSALDARHDSGGTPETFTKCVWSREPDRKEDRSKVRQENKEVFSSKRSNARPPEMGGTLHFQGIIVAQVQTDPF